MSSRPVLRVRKSGAVLVAALIALVGTVPFAGQSWALSPLFLIPITVLIWAWRAGTNVYPDGLRVRALFGSTRVPFDRITEMAPDDRGDVSALLDNGNVIRLTGMTRENLPLVLRAIGQLSPAPAAGSPGSPEPAAAAPASPSAESAVPVAENPAPVAEAPVSPASTADH